MGTTLGGLEKYLESFPQKIFSPTGCPKKTKLLKNGFIMDFFHRIMIAYGLLVYIDYYLLKTWLTLQVRGGYNSYTTGLRSSKLLDISYI